MFLNPLRKSVIIISCQCKDEDVNPLDILFDLNSIVINDLPSKSKCNENSDDGDPTEQ